MEERKFGSFYIDGKVSEPHVDCQLSQVTAISLGDTVHGKELKWVESEGFGVADTEVCLNISWQQLNYNDPAFIPLRKGWDESGVEIDRKFENVLSVILDKLP